MVRLADDRRGRIPFAVVGVLLLLGSTAYATTLATRGPVDDDRAVDRAVADVEASADTALREAVREAARDAARDPVTDPASTPTGAVLREDRAFRDALRVRVYVAARERLRTTVRERGGVRARASLPSTPTPTALDDAKGRVTVERAANGTALRVQIEGIRYVAARDGREALNETRTATLTVAVPVLALHDRTARFERRLNATPTTPGLGRRLTARLYPLAWARGYGQHYGLPVENVVSNHHVALAANGAVLDAERAAFGRADPGGRRGLRRAHAHALATDAGAPEAWADRVLTAPNGPQEDDPRLPRLGVESVPTPASTTRVGASATANQSLGRMLVENGSRSVTGATRAGYRARGRLRAQSTLVGEARRPDPEAPSDDHDLVETDVVVEASVRSGDASLPPVPSGERRVAAHERRVTLDHTVTWTWADGEDETTTTGAWTTVRRVGTVVTVEPDRRVPGPNRTVEPAFERGGPLDGPNMAGTPDVVERRLLADQGGPEAVAAALAREDGVRRSTTVVGEQPDDVRGYVYRSLAGLRDSVGSISVSVRRGAVATNRTNPPAALADRLRERRSALVGAPETYDGAAGRARVVARAIYLNRTIATLERRAANRRSRMAALDRRLRDRTGTGLDGAAERLRASRETTDPARRVVGEGPAGPLVMVPDSSPAYLTVGAVSSERATAVAPGEQTYPLAARNVNVFTVPSGDAVDAVASAGGETPALRTAGRTLRASQRAEPRAEATAERRERLRAQTVERLDEVRDAADGALARETDLGTAERRQALAAAFARWDDPGARALAASNGSLARAVAAEAAESERVQTRVAAAVTPAVAGAAGVDDELVEQTAQDVRRAAVEHGRGRAVASVDDGGTSAYRSALDAARAEGAPPAPVAGVPVAPAPGYWYLTANVWQVTVRGSWARFAVRTRRGVPSEEVTYVRDGSVARLDVDDDGAAERLGRGERVAFETETTVVVAVPPGGAGVGDVGGDADERSAGWPTNTTERYGFAAAYASTDMLHDVVDDPGSLSPAALREAYEAAVRIVVEDHGPETVAAETDVDEATLSRLAAGETAPDLAVTDAAAVLALREGAPDRDATVAALRDHLLMGMATAVVDVDTVAAGIDHDLTGQEVQQALEGRTTMTLAHLAAIQQFVAERAA